MGKLGIELFSSITTAPKSHVYLCASEFCMCTFCQGVVTVSASVCSPQNISKSSAIYQPHLYMFSVELLSCNANAFQKCPALHFNFLIVGFF